METRVVRRRLTAGAFRFCAGHATIEVRELSDTQEKGEESKKSGGPGEYD